MKPYQILLMIFVLLLMSACSEKDNNPTDVDVYGYNLEQFVSKNVVYACVDCDAPDSTDLRGIFAYEIVSGADGFSPRQSSYAGYDLPWNIFKTGYLMPDDSFRTWFDNPSLPSAFKVRNTGLFRLYRKIDVNNGDYPSKMVELMGLPIQNIDNWDGETEMAIKLSDLLQGIAAYDSVSIICYDGYGTGKYYHPEAINDGYYLLNTERTIFPTATLPNNQKRMKVVSHIEVFGATSAQTHNFSVAPDSLANLTVNVPTDLSSYQRTIIPNYGK